MLSFRDVFIVKALRKISFKVFQISLELSKVAHTGLPVHVQKHSFYSITYLMYFFPFTVALRLNTFNNSFLSSGIYQKPILMLVAKFTAHTVSTLIHSMSRTLPFSKKKSQSSLV